MPTSEQMLHIEKSKKQRNREPGKNGTQGNEREPPTREKSIDQIFQSLAELVPNPSPEFEQLKAWKQELDLLKGFPRSSQLLMAVLDPGTLTLRYANEYFCRLAGIEATPFAAASSGTSTGMGIELLDLVQDLDEAAVDRMYRRHVLLVVLAQLYQIDLRSVLMLDEPLLASLNSPLYQEPRFVEFWLCSDELKIVRHDPKVDEFADLDLEQFKEESGEAILRDSKQLAALEQRLQLDNYRIEGVLLLEGVDVTVRETIRRVTQLLIGRDSILRPKKFRQINQYLRSLFCSQSSLILSAERDPARLFIETDSQEISVTSYSLQSLQGSHFLRAAEANQVGNIPDLSLDCPTECDRHLLKLGVRSLLVIPLVVRATGAGTTARQLVGLVGLTSDRPHHFNHMHASHAKELIAPWTVALRQAFQQRLTRFTNIHPSVEWRFLQEAERRSWGLPPEPIVFTGVYPLYGISDIRGSSEERNRAILADLLEQYQLGLNVVEAVCQNQETSLGQQLRLDLLERIEQLQQELTVDAEVTAIQYLAEQVEIYFDHFSQCGAAPRAAIEAYRDACANDHGCVYRARARYDENINQINSLLRETWDRWQVRMQKITPHYCDIECTDGIDHMIYAGESIHSEFRAFHLHSLRYEQLRAVCDCARTALSLQDQYPNHMPVTHLVLVQDATVDIFHDENTENLFDVRGTRDTRYEIVKKRIDKAVDERSRDRITQPGKLTLVYSTNKEWEEYQQYLRYLAREGWVETNIEFGSVEPLQSVTGLKFARIRVLSAPESQPEPTRNGCEK